MSTAAGPGCPGRSRRGAVRGGSGREGVGRPRSSVARTVFLGYVVSLGMGFLGLIPQDLGPYGVELVILVLLALVPYALAARTGFRATGVGYDRRVTVLQFLLGVVMFTVTIAAALVLGAGDDRALFVIGAVPVLGLLWGVFNTWELIFRLQLAGGEER